MNRLELIVETEVSEMLIEIKPIPSVPPPINYVITLDRVEATYLMNVLYGRISINDPKCKAMSSSLAQAVYGG